MRLRSLPFGALVALTAPFVLFAGIAVFLSLASGCRSFAPILESSPRERYERSLETAGLGSRALATAWTAAAQTALARPIPTGEALREVVHFDPARPSAVAFAVSLRRGSGLVVRTAADPPALPLFVELMRFDDGEWKALASAENGAVLEYSPRRDESAVLLVQPELLAGGRVTIELSIGGALLFPVAGDRRSTISSFGDARDGGRRRHQGLDIGAPRGTLALAAADAEVIDVGENALGGRIVRLLTDDGYVLYYAHLDRQLVRRGERVERGEPVGEVGETGNARGTTPHLHFELHADGAGVDPASWIRRPAATEAVRAELTPLGSWMRVGTAGAEIGAMPLPSSGTAGSRLPAKQAARVLGASGSSYRVETPDGATGYVRAAALELLTRPLALRELDLAFELRSQPAPAGVPIALVPAGSKLELLAYSGGSALIRTASGLLGWTAIP